MRKLFGRDKAKASKIPRDVTIPTSSGNTDLTNAAHSNQKHVHQFHDQTQRRSSGEEHWEVVSTYSDGPHTHSHPPTNAASRSSLLVSLAHGSPSPLLNTAGPRSSSPFSTSSHSTRAGNAKDRDAQQTKRKMASHTGGVAALGILKALDPRQEAARNTRPQADGHSPPSEYSPRGEGKETKESLHISGSQYFEEDTGRDMERPPRREDNPSYDEGQVDLTRMIGFLTATSSDDWGLVLEVCERASSNDASAKEAAKALRREFKYAEPPAQLAAARLLAIMLRNSSNTFISQTNTRKFVDTIENVLNSSRTSPVIKDRLTEVVAAATFANHATGKGNDRSGYRSLWRKIKPKSAPDEGIPFVTENVTVNASRPQSRHSGDSPIIFDQQLEGRRFPVELDDVLVKPNVPGTQNHVISPEEDIRRLFQECKIGEGNAALLSEALAYAKPEDLLSKDIIGEFYSKCCASQELIYAQIPWASAGAERSRLAKEQSNRRSNDKPFNPENKQHKLAPGINGTPAELTIEEQLLAALLGANESLLESLRVYEDLERFSVEREVEEMSRMDMTVLPRVGDEGYLHVEPPSHSNVLLNRNHSSSALLNPAIVSSIEQEHYTRAPPHIPNLSQPISVQHIVSDGSTESSELNTLAPHLIPWRPAPQGPRSPALLSLSSPSRTPSPTSDNHSRSSSSGSMQILSRLPLTSHSESDRGVMEPVKPSEKALGKRKVVQSDITNHSEMVYEHRDDIPDYLESQPGSDSEGENRWHQPAHYVYDAAAERTKQRIQGGQLVGLVANGIY